MRKLNLQNIIQLNLSFFEDMSPTIEDTSSFEG